MFIQDDVVQGDQVAPPAVQPQANNPGVPLPIQQGPAEGLGAAHQAMLQGGGPTGFQPYKRPSIFAVRVGIVVHVLL